MKTFFSSHHSSPPASVSDVDLSISCSANGERRVRCSSNGDSHQYSWSLDGRPLSEAVADLSPDNQTLSMRVCVLGTLSCSVRNHVSSTHTSAPLLDSCSGTHNSALVRYSPNSILGHFVWNNVIITSILPAVSDCSPLNKTPIYFFLSWRYINLSLVKTLSKWWVCHYIHNCWSVLAKIKPKLLC